MGKKVHPVIFRIGQIKTWKSRWFQKINKSAYHENLKQDILLRHFLMEKLKKSGIDRIEIEKTVNLINIIIFAVRPGMLIGRGGDSVEKLKEQINIFLFKTKKKKIDIRIQIEQLSHPEAHAYVVAQNIAEQIERRLPFRRVMKKTLEKIMQTKGVEGAKIMLGGRLDGAEIARREWLDKGKMPLQTLRADIDYAEATAFTTYGTVGVKVWIYRGEIFEKEK